MDSFSSIMKLKAFSPFTNAEQALENLNAIKNAEISEDYANFISQNIKKKKSTFAGFNNGRSHSGHPGQEHGLAGGHHLRDRVPDQRCHLRAL